MEEKNVGKRFRRQPKKGNKGIILGILIICLCLIGGFSAYAYNHSQKISEIMAQNGIFPNVTIDGVDVGGLSKEAAQDLLVRSHGKDAANQKLVLYYESEEWVYSFQEIGAEYQVEKAVDAAFNLGRTGTKKENRKVVSSLMKFGEDVPLEFTYDATKMQDKLIEVATQFDREAENSSLTRTNGKFVITKEVPGRKMDLEGTMVNVDRVVESMVGGRAAIVADVTEPEVTYEDNEHVTDLIGSYSTKYTANDKNRNTNLVVGCKYLNGTIIAPGEVFSASEGLGEQTYERGYRDAGVYVNGKVEAGMGGGVCQITSTLYNAAIYAELEIVERHPHSMTVGYVPLGRDAAIAGNYKDLKIKNNTEYPIYLEAYASNGVLEVRLYGHEIHEAGRKVEFETVFEASIPKPDEIVKQDPEKPEGEREVTHTGRTGSKVSVNKKVFQNGKQVSKDWFSSSSYRAVADEVTVGTKKPAVSEQVFVPTQPENGATSGASGEDSFGIQ
ncbi:VanW family protein [Anaerotignum sp.]|uniref:VanW family protein n=1 Tax=Anaerotignum sp. TaxID=2039241 RepID=UPI0028A58F73|nr:VanW family protein [Anaerotignum sp.]